MKTICDFARQRANLSPTAVAFTDVSTGWTVTFAALEDRAERFAAAMEARGFAPGDRIAVLCHNTSVFFEILFGCAKAGLILVPLNWRQTPAELMPILADCGATLLLHDDANQALAQSLTAGATVKALSFARLGELLDASAPRARETAWPAERTWYLLYTSGTTGKPKAVIQTAGMAIANYINVQQATGLSSSDGTPNFLPLFHTAGINLHALPVFLAGGTSYVLAKFDVDAVLDLIEAGKLTVVFGVPAIYQAISLHPRFEHADFAPVRHWGCGGAPLSESLIRTLMARGIRVCNGMGMTETGPTVFFMDQARAAEKIGSVGKPQIMSEVRLVDPDGKDAPQGEAGEIWFRGPGVTPGYDRNAEATANAFEGGWLKSGDVGRRDADGYYYIVDRIKDMYISGGENVYPAEVEAVLHAFPAVLEAAVVGVADAKWGEVGHAVVRARPGQPIDAEALKVFARERLAACKVPKHVTIVDDFPRTAAGKVQKHLLRRQIPAEGKP
ncbi:MAG: long-chain fatty acid--CoA ligase [Hyphomicrobiaceae bacterium]|nr:MAG: long-chain fatty acid--CoA ligase [Hyphomicrobiaceae bacterium]